MRYIEQLNILVTGSWNNKNITRWSVPDFNELNKATTQNNVIKVEIMSESNDRVHLVTIDNLGYINIWNLKRINDNNYNIKIIN